MIRLISRPVKALLLALMAPAWPGPALAHTHWETRCNCCTCGSCWCAWTLVADSRINVLQGALEDDYTVFSTGNGGAAGLSLALAYSTQRAASEFQAADNTSLGFGWAHTFGTFFFRQQGVLYRRDAHGSIVKFNRQPGSSPVRYTPTAGYFETLVANPDGSFTLRYPNGTTEQFMTVSNCPYFFKSPICPLTARVDRYGNRTTLAYDASGRLSTVTDPYGRVITFAYDADHRLQRVTDPLGRATTFAYSPFGAALLQITDPLGHTVGYEYDAQYRVTRKSHKDGHVSLYTYGNDTVTAEYLTAGGDRVFLGSAANTNHWGVDLALLDQQLKTEYLPSAVVQLDARGNPWTLIYDQNAYPTAITAPDGGIRRYVYDPVTLKPAVETDANGNTTFSAYDAMGNLLAVTNCLGQVTRYTYETNFNQVASITDPNGFVTLNRYDARGNLTNRTDPLGFAEQWTYDAHGQVLTETDKNGHQTRHQYDQFGNRTNTVDALDNVTSSTYDALGNLLTVTDPNGHTSAYAYDALNRLVAQTNGLATASPAPLPPSAPLSVELASDGGVQLSWVAPALVLARAAKVAGPYKEVRAEGGLPAASPYRLAAPGSNRSEFYRLQSKSAGTAGGGYQPKDYDSSVAITRYAYDSEGRRTSVIDPNGHTTWYAYDERGRLLAATNALGAVTRYTYDAAGNKTSKTDANQHTTWYAYDGRNRLSFITNALGGVTAYAYDLVGNKIAQTDANGHSVQFAYDCLHRQVAQTNALLYVSLSEYDAANGGGCGCGSPTRGTSLVTKQTDPNGKVTYFKYDPLGRLVTVIRKQTDLADLVDADDAVTAYTYDPEGNRLTMLTRLSATEYLTNGFGYDALNRQVAATNAAGDVTLTAYDPAGNVRLVTAPNGNVTTNTYDTLNRLVEIDDSIGRVGAYSFDAAGNRQSVTDGNTNTTRFAYDSLSRLTTTTDAMNQSAYRSYDPVGNLFVVTDRMTNSTRYAYDPLNRRTHAVDALGCVTTYAYDALRNLVALTDPNGHTTRYQYDALDRLVGETYPGLPGPGEPPGSHLRSFTYDGVGHLISRTDQMGRTTLYRYNDLDLLTERSYVSDPSDRFTYDLAGRMLTAARTNWLTTNDWVVSFAYDGADRVTNTTQNGRVIACAYDIPGHTRTLTYPSGTNLTETTDLRGRLWTVNDSGAVPIATYAYDPGNRVLTRASRNGVTAGYQYNPNNRVTSLLHTNPATATLIAGSTYEYDSESNPLCEANLREDTGSQAYAYDPLYRLTNYSAGSLVNCTVPSPAASQQWLLDCPGNWSLWITNGLPYVLTYDEVHALRSVDARLFSYDPAGNRTNDGRYAYAYDQENRLVQVTRLGTLPGDPRVVGQYAYDALGRRVSKIASPDALVPPAVAVDLYDGVRVIEQEAPSGMATTTFVYGNYVDEVLTAACGSLVRYYHPEALWSPVALSDEAGIAVERYAYTPYGVPAIRNGLGAPVPPNSWDVPHSAVANASLFTGRQFDEESGLLHYRARAYDPRTGSFLQRDPAASPAYEPGLDPHFDYYDRSQSHAARRDRALDLYRYVKGRPTVFLDPTGEQETENEDEPMCVCGPDITNQLRPMAHQIRSILDNLGWRKRLRLCAGSGLQNWDIVPLSIEAICDVKTAKCPQGRICQNTVQVFGRCLRCSEANYFLWGVMMRVCNISRAQGALIAHAWKLKEYRHLLQGNSEYAYRHGYDEARPDDEEADDDYEPYWPDKPPEWNNCSYCSDLWPTPLKYWWGKELKYGVN